LLFFVIASIMLVWVKDICFSVLNNTTETCWMMHLVCVSVIRNGVAVSW